MLAKLPASVADTAAALVSSHPHAPPIDVLALVFQGHEGEAIDPDAHWIRPASPLGQIIAAAFDPCMPPEDWSVWTEPPADIRMREGLAIVWRTEVLPSLATRFGLLIA
jgi:hypothetical protein